LVITFKALGKKIGPFGLKNHFGTQGVLRQGVGKGPSSHPNRAGKPGNFWPRCTHLTQFGWLNPMG